MLIPRTTSRTFVLLLTTLVWMLAICVPAHGATIVPTAGVAEGAGGLRDAIAGSNPGDVIQMPAGTYTLVGGELAVPHDLTIQGADATTTIVDADGTGRVFEVTGGGHVTFTALTIRGGSVVGGFSTDVTGGGVRSTATDLTFTDCIITNNLAQGGAGQFAVNDGSAGGAGGGGVYANDADVVLDNSWVSDNIVAGGLATFGFWGSGGNATGGGLAITGNSQLTVDASTIDGNSANAGGGGFVANVGNGGEARGAGLYVGGTTVLELTGSRIVDNTSNGGAGGLSAGGGFGNLGAGGGLEIAGGTASITTSSIAGNRANGGNGGTSAGYGGFGGGNGAGGIGAGLLVSGGTVEIDQSTISGNEAAAGDEMGVSDCGPCLGTSVGGGIAATGGSLTARAVTITGNSISGLTTQAGGVDVSGTSVTTVLASTITGNTFGVDAANALQTGGGSLTVRGSILADAAAGTSCSGLTEVSSSLIPVGGCAATPPGADNLEAASAGLGALADHGGTTVTMLPTSGSAAINGNDAAGCETALEQRGEGRKFGAACDFGATELTPLVTAPGGAAGTFAPVAIDSVGSQVVLTFTNTGPDTSTGPALGDIALSGADAAQFLIAAPGTTCDGATLAPAASCDVVVTHDTSALGTDTALVTVPFIAAIVSVALSAEVLPAAPECTNLSRSIEAGESIDVTLACTGAISSYSLDTGPALGTASLDGNTVTYHASIAASGTEQLTFYASGPGGNSADRTLSIAITGLEVPSCRNAARTLETGATLSLAVPCSGETDSVEIVSQPAFGRASIAVDKLRYAAPAKRLGTTSFTYRARNARGASDTRTVFVRVTRSAQLVATMTMPARMLGSRVVTGRCAIDYGELESCVAVARVDGAVVGLGKALVPRTRTSTQARFTFRPNDRGRRLARTTPGGVATSVAFEVRTRDDAAAVELSPLRIVMPQQRVVLPELEQFSASDGEPTTAMRLALAVYARLLNRAGATLVTCIGHTAILDSDRGSYALGLERARAACGQLKRSGLEAPIRLRSRAGLDPIASNETEAGRAKNRRVEITARYS